MLFIPNGMKRYLGAFIYALVACQIIRFFFVARILHSDWGALHIEEPVLFSYWYPTVAALAGFLGWLDRKAGLLGFVAILLARAVENMLTSTLPDYHWDYVIIALFSPMALASLVALVSKSIFYLEEFEVEEARAE